MRYLFLVFGLCLLVGCASREVQPITQNDADAVNFPSNMVKARVDALMPLAMQHNRKMQARALEVGTPLNAEGIELARSLGVKNPEKIRIVVVDKIPKFRTADKLAEATPAFTGSATIAGITAGYGIFLAKAYEDKIWVLAHELVHVAQFERWGLEGLVRRVVTQQVALPGRLIPVEREAIDTSSRVLRIDPPAYAF